MMYEIVNPDNLFYSKNSKLVNDFMDFSSKNLRFEKPVTIDFIEDNSAGQDPLGKTAHYNPQEMSIVVYTTNRHPKDILRSLSHELVHHCQNCEERIPSNSSTKEGYAQTDETMRSLESEAYLKGNIMNFRDFEDQYKMKKNKKQINELTAFEKRLAQARGLNPRDIEKSDDVYNDKLVAKKRAEREKLAKDLKVAPGEVADLDLPALRQRRDSFRAATGSDPAPAPTPKPSPPKPKRRQPSGPHIERLQRALVNFGMRLKVDGIFGRGTQAAINRVRSNWPTAPKRSSNFNASVKGLTKWLEANKNTGREVKTGPAKQINELSSKFYNQLAKSKGLNPRDFKDPEDVDNDELTIAFKSPEYGARFLNSQNKSNYVSETEGVVVQKSVQHWARKAITNPEIAKRFIDEYTKVGGEFRGGAPRFAASFNSFSDVDVPFVDKNLKSLASSAKRSKKPGPEPGPEPKPTPPKPQPKKPNKAVKELQELLKGFGFDPGCGRRGCDGLWGPKTAGAVRGLRKNWPTVPKKNPNLRRDIKLVTDWLKANKGIEKREIGAAKKAAAKQGKTYKQFAGDLGYDTDKIEKNFPDTFKESLRENQKAARSEMLSRILTERLLGRNVKIKIKNN